MGDPCNGIWGWAAYDPIVRRPTFRPDAGNGRRRAPAFPYISARPASRRTALKYELPRKPVLSTLLALVGAGSMQATGAAAAAETEDDPAPDAGDVAVVEGRGATLEVRFDYATASDALTVSYCLRNTGDAALMVFDRGNRHAVMSGRQVQGEVPAPLFTLHGGDVALSHRALPLSIPTPTMPPLPLAARVEPGDALQGGFEYASLTAQPPRRLRWCLGVAPFAQDDFRQLESRPSQQRDVWQASLAVVERQQLLCTPWYEVAAGAFAKPVP